MVTKIKTWALLSLMGIAGACSFQNKISELEYANLNELEKKYYKIDDTVKVISLSKKQYPDEIDTNLKFQLEDILEKEKVVDLVVFPEFTFIDEKSNTFFSKKNEEYLIHKKTTPVIKNEIKNYQELAKKYNTNLFLGGFMKIFLRERMQTYL